MLYLASLREAQRRSNLGEIAAPPDGASQRLRTCCLEKRNGSGVARKEGAGDRRLEGDRVGLRRGAGRGGVRRGTGGAYGGRSRNRAGGDRRQAQCRGAGLSARSVGQPQRRQV